MMCFIQCYSLACLGSTLPVAQTSVVDIALTLVNVDNTAVALRPGGIGLGMDSFSMQSIYLVPGYQLFGFVEITQWRFMKRTFREMLGFSTVCTAI